MHFSKTLPDLVKILEEESNVSLDWLKSNEMIANPEKFNALIVKKDRSDTNGVPIKLKDDNIQSETNVKLLGIKLDNQLNFVFMFLFVCHIFLNTHIYFILIVDN